MRLEVDLTWREFNLILQSLAKEHTRIRTSKAKNWDTSTKVMAMADITRVEQKLVNAELASKKKKGEQSE